MALSVSRRPLIAYVRVRYQVSPCKIHGGGTRTGFGFYFRVLLFSLVYVVTLVLQTHLHLHTGLTRKTKGRSLETFQTAMLFRKSGSTGWKSTFTFLFSTEDLSRSKNKSDVHNLLLSASQKTHCAYVVLGEIITVYF